MRVTEYGGNFEIISIVVAFVMAAIGAILKVEHMFPAMIAMGLFGANRAAALNQRKQDRQEQEHTRRHQERLEKLLKGILDSK